MSRKAPERATDFEADPDNYHDRDTCQDSQDDLDDLRDAVIGGLVVVLLVISRRSIGARPC